MRLIKLAAGRKIKIRVTIDYKTGVIHPEVIDNPNGEGCGEHGANEQILRDLMAADVPEFGSVDVTAAGLTEQGFLNRMKKTTKPLPVNPLKNPKVPHAPTPGQPVQNQPVQEGQVETGFGV